MVLVYRDNPFLTVTAIYLLCQEWSSGEALHLLQEGFTVLIWVILLSQQRRYDSCQAKSTNPQCLYFPFALYISSQKYCWRSHRKSPYITIYSPFLLHYPKWNRHAITKPAHAILYSLQFPTSHLKNKYFTVIWKYIKTLPATQRSKQNNHHHPVWMHNRSGRFGKANFEGVLENSKKKNSSYKQKGLLYNQQENTALPSWDSAECIAPGQGWRLQFESSESLQQQCQCRVCRADPHTKAAPPQCSQLSYFKLNQTQP